MLSGTQQYSGQFNKVVAVIIATRMNDRSAFCVNISCSIRFLKAILLAKCLLRRDMHLCHHHIKAQMNKRKNFRTPFFSIKIAILVIDYVKVIIQTKDKNSM